MRGVKIYQKHQRGNVATTSLKLGGSNTHSSAGAFEWLIDLPLCAVLNDIRAHKRIVVLHQKNDNIL